jgi:hypothetical protein
MGPYGESRGWTVAVVGVLVNHRARRGLMASRQGG